MDIERKEWKKIKKLHLSIEGKSYQINESASKN